MGQLGSCGKCQEAFSNCQSNDVNACGSSCSTKDLNVISHSPMLMRDGDVIRIAGTVVGFGSACGVCKMADREKVLKSSLPSLFRKEYAWTVGHETLVDMECSWERIVNDCPQYRHWTLKTEAYLNNVGRMRLDVSIGGDEDGRSLLSSEQTSCPTEDMELYFDLGHLEIRLWLERCTTTFHKVLCCLGQTQFSRDCKSEGEPCHFSLIGLLDSHRLVRTLRLRFYWMRGLAWQCKELPFSFQLAYTNIGNAIAFGSALTLEQERSVVHI